MILTTCAACAAPLAHNAPRCVRCHTRYCDATCQHDHWRRGHKQICKKIHRGGNAEQYYADKKYKEAVAVAVEKCAADIKGQTCYICMEGVKRRTGEGLVSGFCSCRGGSSFAHVSCLAEQAKVLVAEAEANNLDYEPFHDRFVRWHTCSLCEQYYHGVVQCALGWACWKTYVGQQEWNRVKNNALVCLSSALGENGQHEAELQLLNVQLATALRERFNEITILGVQNNRAACLESLGRLEESLALTRLIYDRRKDLHGPTHELTLAAGFSLAGSLNRTDDEQREAMALVQELQPAMRQVLGESHLLTLKLDALYGSIIYNDRSSTPADFAAAVPAMEDVIRRMKRVLGASHPSTITSLSILEGLKKFAWLSEFPRPPPRAR